MKSEVMEKKPWKSPQNFLYRLNILAEIGSQIMFKQSMRGNVKTKSQIIHYQKRVFRKNERFFKVS